MAANCASSGLLSWDIGLKENVRHRLLVEVRLVVEPKTPGPTAQLRGDRRQFFDCTTSRHGLRPKHLNMHVLGESIPTCHDQDWETLGSAHSCKCVCNSDWYVRASQAVGLL